MAMTLEEKTKKRGFQMKTIVVYTSQTGFTQRYAEWISEAIGADLITVKEAKGETFKDYDAIVFGGWACAGTISKLNWFKSNMDRWEDKKLVAFCVGGSPIENPDVEVALNNCFSPLEQEKVKVVYCPGGFNYERMSAASKLMMKMFVKTLKAKKEKTEADEIMIKMISSSYDISDKKYIEPILEYLR